MRFLIVLQFLFCSLGLANSQAFYTIIDDDAESIKSINAIKELSDKKGIKISFAPISKRLERNKELTDSLLSYQAQGFHVCNHSYSHSSDIWKGQDLPQIGKDTERASMLLDSLGFKNHEYLVYPFGKFDKSCRDSILHFASRHFKLAFNSRGFYNDFGNGCFNKFYINRFPFRSHYDWLAVRNIIDDAAESNAWIVFLTHSYEADFNIDELERIIDYCQERGMDALTVHEAFHAKIQYEQSYEASGEFGLMDEIADMLYLHRFSIVVFGVAVGAVLGIMLWIRK